jgi:hypothetical protein
MTNSISNKVSWFQRAKSAVKAAATKVVSALSRAKHAVLAKVEPVLKTRAVRVMRTIGRWATIILGSVAAISVAFAAPILTLLVVLAAAVAIGTGLLVKRYARLPGFMWDAFAAVAKVAVVVGKVLFGLVSTAMFFAIVAGSAMTPAGIVNFVLAFWVLYSIEMGADAKTPEEKRAADAMWRTATTVSAINDLYNNVKRATA